MDMRSLPNSAKRTRIPEPIFKVSHCPFRIRSCKTRRCAVSQTKRSPREAFRHIRFRQKFWPQAEIRFVFPGQRLYALKEKRCAHPVLFYLILYTSPSPKRLRLPPCLKRPPPLPEHPPRLRRRLTQPRTVSQFQDNCKNLPIFSLFSIILH